MGIFFIIISIIGLVMAIILFVLAIKFLFWGAEYFKFASIKVKKELGIEDENIKTVNHQERVEDQIVTEKN